MEKIELPEELQPKEHYVQSFITGSDYHLRLIDGQYIMLNGSAEPKMFVKTSGDWKVAANRPKRKEHPVGSIFKLPACVLLQSTTKKWAYCFDKEYLEKVDSQEAEEKIEEFAKKIKSFLESGMESEEPEAVEEEEVKIPETTEKEDISLTEKLLKEHPKPTIRKDEFYVETGVWKLLVRNVFKRKNVLLVGDSGIGKTELINHLSASFGYALHMHDMGTMQDPIASMVGVHRIKDGKSVFDVAQFAKDIQDKAIVLLDEVNRAPLNTNNILFPLLDRRRSLEMAIASSDLDRSIKVHENAVFVATANIGSRFTGTNAIDAAFKDRFIVVKLDYPPKEAEINLLMKRTGIVKDKAKKLVDLFNAIRAKYKNDVISNTISIRQSLEIAELVVDGYAMIEAVETYLKPLFEEEYVEIKDLLHSW